jgi:hypothetical protein
LKIPSPLPLFVMIYEFIRVIVDEKYAGYKFSRFSGYRNSRRIDPQDQLLVYRLRKESPLYTALLTLASYPAAKAIKIMVETLERLVNARVRHKILKLKAAKLERELATPAASESPRIIEADAHFLAEQLRAREGEYFFTRIERHLQENPIRLTGIDVKHLPAMPAPGAAPDDDEEFEEDDEEPGEE